MQITITVQTILTAAACVAALIALFGYLFKGYDFVKRQKEQDLVIQDIQAELTLHTYGVLACLKGLKEQGCNGPVTEAINKIEKHLNQKAHDQK